MKAFLPENVSLTGQISPSREADRITFDSQSREIVWNVGELFVGQGVLNEPLSVSFQVSLNPRSGQRDQAAELIGQARITGQDKWTDQVIQSISSGLTTVLSDDQSAGIVK